MATADHAWRAGSELDADLGLDILDTVIGRGLARSAYADVTVHTSHALDICRRMPPKPEALERQAKLWLNLAGMRSILHGQSSGLVNEALQRAFEIGREVKGRSFYYLGFCFPWFFDKTHAVFGRFGWKLKLAHNGMSPDAPEQDRIRASVYRVSFWKAID